MTQELTKKSSTSVANSELIKKAKSMSGEFTGSRIPFIPILTINNKSEEKTAIVDGVEQTVEVLPKKGWIINRKDENGNYVKEYWGEKLSGVILRDRFMIRSKYKGDPSELSFRSDEFDDWNQNVTLYNIKNRKDIIFEGSYKEMRETFTSTNDKGEKEKGYQLIVVLYVNVEDSGEVLRVELKMTQDNKWFDYKSEFGENDTFVAHMTNFNLEQNKVGKVTYYYVQFETGDPVDLTKQIELQKEIQKFFNVAKIVSAKNKGELNEAVQPSTPDDGSQSEWTDDDDKKIEQSVDSIPF